jgi:hypothetical protein
MCVNQLTTVLCTIFIKHLIAATGQEMFFIQKPESSSQFSQKAAFYPHHNPVYFSTLYEKSIIIIWFLTYVSITIFAFHFTRGKQTWMSLRQYCHWLVRM